MGQVGTTQPSGRAVRTFVDRAVFVVVLAGLWLLLGPVQLGGPASYVIVDGTSMEPTYRDGDLVVSRERDQYGVGDVVTYAPDVAGQPFPVIHRIVEVAAPGEYVTRGDNRDEVDGWLATDADIVGASWAHVPYGGTVLEQLRRPVLWLAAAIGLCALGLLSTRDERRGSAGQEAS